VETKELSNQGTLQIYKNTINLFEALGSRRHLWEESDEKNKSKVS